MFRQPRSGRLREGSKRHIRSSVSPSPRLTPLDAVCLGSLRSVFCKGFSNSAARAFFPVCSAVDNEFCLGKCPVKRNRPLMGLEHAIIIQFRTALESGFSSWFSGSFWLPKSHRPHALFCTPEPLVRRPSRESLDGVKSERKKTSPQTSQNRVEANGFILPR